MNKNEWEQMGEDIRRQVQTAIDSNNFSELSKTISNTVSQAVNDVGKSLNGAFNDVMNGAKESIQQTVQKTPNQTCQNGVPGDRADRLQNTEENAKHQKWARYGTNVYYGKPNLRPSPKLFVKHPKGAVSGVFLMLGGFGLAGFMGIKLLYTMLNVFVLGGGVIGAVDTIGKAVGFAVLGLAGLGAGIRGANLRGRATRFRHYVTMVKDKLYCSIEDMAAKTGRSERFIRKDLKRMMQKGMFLQAHLDKGEDCFIASDEVYEQYCITQKQYEETKLSETVQSQAQTSEETTQRNEKVLAVLDEGRDYIRMIRLCNDEIPGESMSEKLDKLELLVTRIFAQVEKEPEQAPELQKMLSYYLPTTQKLLETYRDLDKQTVEVKNISETKKEIEATIDTINAAFEKFLDELFRDKAWDIQSDISVLNTMLKQDGYLKDDFEKTE